MEVADATFQKRHLETRKGGCNRNKLVVQYGSSTGIKHTNREKLDGEQLSSQPPADLTSWTTRTNHIKAEICYQVETLTKHFNF